MTFGNENGAARVFDCLQLTDVKRLDLKSESIILKKVPWRLIHIEVYVSDDGSNNDNDNNEGDDEEWVLVLTVSW